MAEAPAKQKFDDIEQAPATEPDDPRRTQEQLQPVGFREDIAGLPVAEVTQSSLSLPRPEKYRLVGSLARNAVVVPRAIDYIKSRPSLRPDKLPREIPRSPLREEQVMAVTASVVDFVRSELGVDVSSRMLDSNEIRFFAPADWEEFGKLVDLTDNTDGLFSHTGVYVREQPNAAYALGVATHELVHHASNLSYSLRQKEDMIAVNPHRTGYQNSRYDSLAMVDETLTEITSLEIITKYWQKHDALEGLLPSKIGYTEHVILMDELIEAIAQRVGTTKLATLRELQRGKILGKVQTLHILTDTIGKDGMKILAKLSVEDPDTALQAASQFGLTKAVRKLEDLKNGRSVTVLEGILDTLPHVGGGPKAQAEQPMAA